MASSEATNLKLAISTGDSRAFKALFDSYYPRLYRLAYHYLKSDVACEEVVSDVFIKLWNNRTKLVAIETLEFYLFRAVKNQALSYLKKEMKAVYSLYANSPSESSRIDYLEPDQMLIARELNTYLQKAIEELPERCRTIFRMVREDELTYKEVAQLLDVSPKTVENQMSIALKKLKLALDAYNQTTASTQYISLFSALSLLEYIGSQTL